MGCPLWCIGVDLGSWAGTDFYDSHQGALLAPSAMQLPSLTRPQIAAGRPRPDLFSRCQIPDDYTQNPVHGLTSWTICTRTDLLTDGFRSFPSGHASFAWSGMWYLILYSAASEHHPGIPRKRATSYPHRTVKSADSVCVRVPPSEPPRTYMEVLGSTRTFVMQYSDLHLPDHGLSTSLNGRYSWRDHRYLGGLAGVQAVLSREL